MLNQSLHRQYMIGILKDLFSAPMGKYLALKGGTLSYLAHGLDRFSTDLDLDVVNNKIDASLVDYVKKVIKKHGDIKNETTGQSLYRFILSYQKDSHNIKIELNARISPFNRYEFINLFGVDIQCMDKETLYANKLYALSNRIANRDLYDVRWMHQHHFSFNEKVITERTGKTLLVFWEDLRKHIHKNFRENTILGQLGLVLDDKQKNEVKKNLVKDVLDIIDFWVEENSLDKRGKIKDERK